MTLRDYQLLCSDAIFEKWREHQSTLLVLYTGGGKTIIFADVIKRMHPGRSLVLANREELIFQAKDKIERTTGLHCELEMADFVASSNLFTRADVVVATVQTMISGKHRKRMERFRPEDFSLLVIDEAHMGVAASFRKVIDYFKRNPKLKILGCTATPDRHDKQALSQIFESVAASYDILDGIHGGWLCDITQQFVPVAGLDYSHVRTTAGDLNAADLAAVMEAESNIMGICQPSLEVLFGLKPKTLDGITVPEWGKYCRELGREARRAIVFTASVAQAEMCCQIFNRVIPGLADWVCGETDKVKRRKLLQDFSAGKPRVIANCGVLTHGFDDPGVEVILMAHPTKSRSRYAQMVGRSTRPLPGVVDGEELDTAKKRIAAIAASGKPYCRIIDFVGNAGKHKLVTSADILGGKVSDEAVQKVVKQAITDGKPIRVARTLDEAEIKLLEEREKEAERRRQEEAARKAGLVARSKFSIQDVDPFDLLNITRATPYSRGYKKPPTKRMVEFLASRGIDAHRHRLTFTDAGNMIGKIKQQEASAPPSKAQQAILVRYKLPLNTTKRKASQWITKIAENNWTKPDGLVVQ